MLSLLVIVQYWLVLRAAARLPDNWPEATKPLPREEDDGSGGAARQEEPQEEGGACNRM